MLHPGEGAGILEPIVGTNSVILLDEDAHLSQRKLILPAFHGDRIEGLADLVAEIADEQISSWPTGEVISLHRRLQDLTLEAIMRAVFGIRSAARRGELGPLLAEMLEFGTNPISLIPWAQRAPFSRGPWARFLWTRERIDEILFAEFDERGGAKAGGSDILSTLLQAFTCLRAASSSTTTPGSTPSPTPSVRSASSRRSRAPTCTKLRSGLSDRDESGQSKIQVPLYLLAIGCRRGRFVARGRRRHPPLPTPALPEPPPQLGGGSGQAPSEIRCSRIAPMPLISLSLSGVESGPPPLSSSRAMIAMLT